MSEEDPKFRHRALVLGASALLIWFAGARAAWVLADSWGMGLGTQLIWLWAAAVLAGSLLEDVSRSEKPWAVALSLLLLVVGWAIHALGWSGVAA